MHSMKKRLFCLLLALLMLLGVAGCSADDAKELISAAVDVLAEEDSYDDTSDYDDQSAYEEEETAAPAEDAAQVEDVQTEDEAVEAPAETDAQEEAAEADGITVTEDGTYSDKDHVALYLHTYGHLPDNYITKSEAEDLGWVSSQGNLWDVAPGKSIGGDKFGNREGLLPSASGRKWYECDIDFEGGRRNAKRILFSNDGLIYYTEDHYASFTQLY